MKKRLRVVCKLHGSILARCVFYNLFWDFLLRRLGESVIFVVV